LGMKLRGGLMIGHLFFFPWLPLSSDIYNHIRFRYIAPVSRAGYVISPFLTGDLSRMGVEEVPLVD
jgi:hypothetical protein